MKDILEMRKLHGGCPVMIADIPRPIMKEIGLWTKECRKIKDHPLAELKAHENAGYLAMDDVKYNSYQVSVPKRLIDESFWLAWTVRLAAKYWGNGKPNRAFRLCDYPGHFDGYDVWANFAYKGDQNPRHTHHGNVSGVIYYQNHDHPTVFEQTGDVYHGKNGTMVMFPSDTLHYVVEQKSNKERITYAFNLEIFEK